jgi:hypothetical protein
MIVEIFFFFSDNDRIGFFNVLLLARNSNCQVIVTHNEKKAAVKHSISFFTPISGESNMK